MRITHHPAATPPTGAIRAVTKFLWWPTTSQSPSGLLETRWLEKATLLQRYREVMRGTERLYACRAWVNVRFID